MKNEELVNVIGGGTVSSTVINSIVKVVAVALEIGRTVGSAIRRKINGSKCAI